MNTYSMQAKLLVEKYDGVHIGTFLVFKLESVII